MQQTKPCVRLSSHYVLRGLVRRRTIVDPAESSSHYSANPQNPYVNGELLAQKKRMELKRSFRLRTAVVRLG